MKTIALFISVTALLPLLAGCESFGQAVAQSYQRRHNRQHNYRQPDHIAPNTSAPSDQQLGNITPNAYGLGVNSDQYGRPQTYYLQDGSKLSPIFQSGVQQNAYGPGIGMDQFGRPVRSGPP